MNRMMLCLGSVWAFLGVAAAAQDAPAPDFSRQVAPIFVKYCTGCHNAKDREGKLSLDSFAELQQGGESGAAVLPGQADASRLIRVLTGADEPRMPPEGERQPRADEIALLRAWIHAGAKGPQGVEPDRKTLQTPTLAAAPGAAGRVYSIAYSPDGKHYAVGRYGSAELRTIEGDASVRVLDPLPGKVLALHFSRDGQSLVTASGVAGLYGLATVWKVADGRRILDIEGHRDILYDAEFSPDSQLLATCSYDRQIAIWTMAGGQPLRVLDGHNDAVYDVAFSPDGTVLASASGDKTVKLWKVATGERLDTLSQPLGEQYVVTFSPDGRFVLAGGVDNRIRVWEFVSRDKPQINPLRYARFAHEGAVLTLAFTPDGQRLLSTAEDRTIKQWETQSYTQTAVFDPQPEQVVHAAVAIDARRVSVVRQDGSLVHHPLTAASRPAADAATGPARTAGSQSPLPSPSEVAEHEPNDTPAAPQAVMAPTTIRGVIHTAQGSPAQGSPAQDVDLFRFSATAGQEWMIEVQASRQKSPLDSKIEVLDAQGHPVPRVLLRAVRDAYFTFRGKDFDTSDDFRLFNWEEMEINELLYCNGEVVKLWHYPRGPDSGFIVYPGRGRRWNLFDTTPISHALGEPCYVVEPHPPGTALIPNGLPTFLLFHENDDDAWRQWGSDSRLSFVPPADGDYLVRLTDARGFGGEDFAYQLLIRQRRPDFTARLEGIDPTVNAGSGKEFKVEVERLDAFDGEIRIDVEGLPPGFFASTPLVIQAGQSQALGTLNALPDAPPPTPEQAKASKVIASATIGGQVIKKEVGTLGEIKLAGKPKVFVRLLPSQVAAGSEPAGTVPWQSPLELVIQPGRTTTARVVIERHDFNERVPFGNFDAGRNLPHGVYVDNIGLNGLMIVEGQSERTFFITAAPGVPEQTRLFHLQAQVDGNQTSWPVILHVRRGK